MESGTSPNVERELGSLRIERDDLTRPAVLALLREHLANMHEITPADKVFAFDASRLRAADVTFWTVWEGDELLGCGALKELGPTEGEIKSMRTPKHSRRRGAGKAVLELILTVAKNRGYETLYLETGAHPDFAPAHALYERYGFRRCGAFGPYRDEPTSVFMSLHLGERA